VVKDSQGRNWQVVRDGSIKCQKKVSGQIVSADDSYSVELVSPKCKYEDIETVQEIVRLLRKAGAIANSSCGIHVHIDGSNHTAKSLKNVINIMASKEDLIYRALEIDSERQRKYCKKVNSKIVEKIKANKNLSMVELSDIWYDGYYGDRNRHYHDSRYFGLNLHATFSKGTVEFRLFNGTTHAGKIKAYIQFCLAISNQAIQQKSASSTKTESSNEKYTFRTWLLRL
jgi:sulfur transfer complex TusBCD TusB component (DsrH family)